MFIHLLFKHLLSSYYIPDTGAVRKFKKILPGLVIKSGGLEKPGAGARLPQRDHEGKAALGKASRPDEL